MADFLASFNFGAAEDEPVRDEASASLDEVQARFRELFLDRVTETRAEHIKTTLEIGPTTQFTIFGGQGENVDPSLSRVSAREALVSQPQYNPTVQKAVSQEILNAIGGVDRSTWSMSDESRKTQGWVFTYSCNHSWQQWTRHGKTVQKHAVLDYSQKELDFTSRARPAFDCRGSISVFFSKTNGAITLNYSHTPIHRTVGEVYDMFKPALPRQSVLPKKKAPGSAKKSVTPRRKRPATDANGESVPKKQRKKPKAGTKNQLSQAELVPITDIDFAPTNGGPMITMGDASDHIALAALSAATATESVNHVPVPNNDAASAPKNNTASLNVSPEEAARRREVATTKLTEVGISLSSLSDDQFSIFSNQSPEVQAESLKMLVKYGAERLHIVHPTRKDSPRLPASQPVAESVASGLVNPQFLGNETGNTNPRPDEADEPVDEPIAASKTPQKTKWGTKSRVFCFNCKISKSQCSKDKPACNVCQDSGLTCEYPAVRLRTRKSAAIVVDVDDTIMTENLDVEGEEDEGTTEEAPGLAEVPDLRQPPTYGQAPIADMMQITPDDQGSDSRPIGETTMQPTVENRVEPSPVSWSSGSSGLALPRGRVYYPTTTPNDHVQNNDSATIDTERSRGSRQAATSTARGNTRVPTPTQTRLAEPPRERHESPLEWHNPMRHETYPTYQQSPLTLEKVSPPTPYSQPVQPQHGSDPYTKFFSYGNHQGNYPQLDDTAPERIAYDPNAYKQNPASRAFTPQLSGMADHSTSTAKGSKGLPNRQEVSVADTLQRFRGYGNDNSHQSNVMLPVHAPSQQHRGTGGSGAGLQRMMGVSKHGAPKKTHQSQPVGSRAAPNQSQQGQQQSSWYSSLNGGLDGLHGGSSNNAHQNHDWGSGHGSWN